MRYFKYYEVGVLLGIVAFATTLFSTRITLWSLRTGAEGPAPPGPAPPRWVLDDRKLAAQGAGQITLTRGSCSRWITSEVKGTGLDTAAWFDSLRSWLKQRGRPVSKCIGDRVLTFWVAGDRVIAEVEIQGVAN